MRPQTLLAIVALGCAALSGERVRPLPKMRTVYVAAMSNHLDYHLASQLTSNGVLWVVLDPARADAILSDRVDDVFWAWLNQQYKPSGQQNNTPAEAFGYGSDRVRKLWAGPWTGNVFLVDPKARVILWSTYDSVKDGSSNDLDRAAARIAIRLKASVFPK